MIDFGLPTADALVAATSGGAHAVGLGEHVGTIEKGKLADLVVVDGDPLLEPELLCDPDRIWLVLRLGKPVGGTALERVSPFPCETAAASSETSVSVSKRWTQTVS